jgi:hypothetical protein
VLSRVDLHARIRDRRMDSGVWVRELARRHGVHRRAGREALMSAVPPERKKPGPGRLVLEPAVGWIDAMLREGLAVPLRPDARPRCRLSAVPYVCPLGASVHRYPLVSAVSCQRSGRVTRSPL